LLELKGLATRITLVRPCAFKFLMRISDVVKRLCSSLFHSRDLISFDGRSGAAHLEKRVFFIHRQAVCKWIRTKNNESGQQREMAHHYASPRCPCNPLCRMILVALCSVTQFASRHAGAGPPSSNSLPCDEALKKWSLFAPCLVQFPQKIKCEFSL
jgi:hypothetical protein